MAMSGSTGTLRSGHRRSRNPRRRKTLKDVVKTVLRGNKTLTVSDTAPKVLKAGYKTKTTKHLRAMVQAVVCNNPHDFKRLKRGVYRTRLRRPNGTGRAPRR